MTRSLNSLETAKRTRPPAVLLLAAVLGATAGLGQEPQGGAPAGGAAGGAGGAGGVGGATAPSAGTGGIGGIGTTPGRPGQPQQPGQFPERMPFPEMQRMIFLSGKVVMEDGTPPPEPVVIERVCNGQPRPEAYTDQKGRFSFQLGGNQAVFSDASYGGFGDTIGGASNDPFSGQRNSPAMAGMGGRQISERDLMGCELRAVLAGFRADPVPLSGRRSLDNPDVGTIILRRLANVEGTTVSAIAMQAPKDAKKALEKAQNFVKKNKANEALREYEKAIQLYPKYTTAYYEMGRVLEMTQQTEPARQAYLKAIEIDPKYLHPYRQLAAISIREQKWEDAAEYSGKAIKLNPVDFADLYFYNSVAHYYLKHYDEAQHSALEARKLDTRNRIPKVHQLLGAIYIEQANYAAASTHMKDYLKFLPAGQEAEQMQRQIEELDKAAAARSDNR